MLGVSVISFTNMSLIIYFRNMPLFGKSQKNPVEVVKQIKEAVVALEKGDKKLEKVSIHNII